MRWSLFLHRQSEDWREDLERRLETVFPPVQPRAEFRAHLKSQLLAHMPAPVEVQRRKAEWTHKMLWISLGVVGALTLVVNGVRVVISILAALGLWQEARKRLQEQENTASPPWQAA